MQLPPSLNAMHMTVQDVRTQECCPYTRADRLSSKWDAVEKKIHIYVANRLQTWPVCKWPLVYKPVVQFLNWLARFQLYKAKWSWAEHFESWPNGLEAGWMVYKQPEHHESCTSLPNKHPLARTAGRLAKWFTEGTCSPARETQHIRILRWPIHC